MHYCPCFPVAQNWPANKKERLKKKGGGGMHRLRVFIFYIDIQLTYVDRHYVTVGLQSQTITLMVTLGFYRLD